VARQKIIGAEIKNRH